MKSIKVNFSKCPLNKIIIMCFIMMGFVLIGSISTAYAAPVNTISFSADPFGGGYRTTPYNVLTSNYGNMTFIGTDATLGTGFGALSWTAGDGGMAYGETYSGNANIKGLTLSDGSSVAATAGTWFVFGTETRSTKFSFKSFKVGENQGQFNTMEIIGLRGGLQVASQIVPITPFTEPTAFVSMISDFEYVDEVRMRQKTTGFYDSGKPGFEGIVVNDIVIDAPVVPSKTLTADTIINDVDHDIEVTFGTDATFQGAITGVSFNGHVLTSNQYTASSDRVTLKPSSNDNTYLRTPATGNVVITATGYGDSTVSQTINAGSVASLAVSQQPIVGVASGDAFATQPIVTLKDQYNNTCSTGPSATASVVASAKAGSGTWTMGGTATKPAVAGVASFVGLTCTLTTVGDGAITFTSGGPTVDSNPFTIPIAAGKTLIADTTINDVDHDIEVTFGADATFQGAITGVSFNGHVLTSNQYTASSDRVTLKPSSNDNTYLRIPATGNVVITATGYNNSTVSQTINAGAVASLAVSQQPIVGVASGDAFATQPIVTLKDQYGNTCSTGPSATASVVASAKAGSGTWTMGGTATKPAVAGVASFVGLTCTLTTVGDGAITFTSGGPTVDSSTFTIPTAAGKTLIADTTINDVDHDIEVTFGTDATFQGAITGVSFNGHVLTSNQYTASSDRVTLKPSSNDNTYLRTPATGNVVITATGYGDSTVSQTINAGSVASLAVSQQPIVGVASGDAFATQPIVTLKDQYGNICSTGPSATASVVATAKAGTGTWTIGGTVTKVAVAGVATFTDLTCTLLTAGNGAITFTSGVPNVDSNTFIIPTAAGKALTASTTNNDVDHNIDVTFTPDAAFQGAITGVSFNGIALTLGTDYDIYIDKVTLKPSSVSNVILRTPATGAVVITAAGYNDSTVLETINAGAAASFVVTGQPVPGAASGDNFATQPVVTLKDQYNNTCSTGVSAAANVVATVGTGGTGTWTIGGTTTTLAIAGVATFGDLSSTLLTPGNGIITFTSGGYTANSNVFTIPTAAGKTLTAATTNNDVDHNMDVTFGADSAYEAAITGVSFNGHILTSNQYSVGSGKVTLKPSNNDNLFLRTPATGNVVVTATGYNNSTVSQTINAGTVASLVVTTQPAAGAVSGAVFGTQPIVTLKDQYNNTCSTGVSVAASVVATAKAGTGTWTIGGTSTKAATAGIATFTDLTSTLLVAGTGAITFTCNGYTVDSNIFTISSVPIAPSITTQPADQTVTVGQPASFSVVAIGTAPLSYQWKKAGININGAVSSNFDIASTNFGDAGSYTVFVSNAVGSVTSIAITLIVDAVAPTEYTITYIAGGNGTTTGSAIQVVNSGASGTPVTAVPNTGYYFVNWSDGITTATRTDRNVTANKSVTANFAVNSSTSSSGGGSSSSGGGSTSVSTTTGTTSANANVVSKNGQAVKAIPAQVTAETDGTETVTMKASDAIVIQQADGTSSTLVDLSKLGFSTPATSTGTGTASITIAADGTIQVKGLANSTETQISITYDLGNGQKITLGSMNIKVGSKGEVTLACSLIDPYGIITDEATGKIIDGVNVTLYYANTDRNKAAGKTPDTIVVLPGIDGFKPNNNKNPQVSDATGAYGFMVFPTSDYYVVGTKDGYNKYVSPTISVEQEIVKWNFAMHSNGTERLAGDSRVDTSIAIAKATYQNTLSNVILATSENYPDALAGSVLAYKLNAPILLVGISTEAQAKVLDYLKANMGSTGKVYIIGGSSVVSSDMEAKVTALGFKNIIRLGGADRYETAVKIADTVGVKEGTPIVLVSGENYPDALSISSVAAVNQYPIFIVGKDGISDLVKNEISKINPSKVFIIGAEGAVSKAMEAQIAVDKGNIVRIEGANRFETSLAVAKYFKLTGSITCIATGNDFPDALAGSAYAAKNNAQIILVDKALTEDESSYLQSVKLSGATIFGGEGVVSNNIVQQISTVIRGNK